MVDPLFDAAPPLVEIRLLGRALRVPAADTLLRQLQFVFPSVGEGRFCWNGECRECEVTLRRSGSGTATGLACQIRGVAGLDVVRVSPELRYRLGADAARTDEEAESPSSASEP